MNYYYEVIKFIIFHQMDSTVFLIINVFSIME